ncbi:carbohydrate-binding protein [Cupriavidus basilensis]
MTAPFFAEMEGPLAIQFLNYLWKRVTEQIAGTSTSNLTIGTGAKGLTTQADKQFAVGMPVRITRTSDVTQWMDGQVSAYDAATGAMTVAVATTSGAGTYANWTVSLSGQGGPAGEPGEDGADGLDGWTPVFAVAADGVRRVLQVVDWIGGEGAKPAVGRYVGAAGFTTVIGDAVNMRGDKGEVGDTGPANTLSIGTVAGGENASASISGEAPNQTLDLVLPKGDKGDQGDKGDTGDTGPANEINIGTVTTGAAGSDASATITGAAPNQILSLVIPRGDNGEVGEQGDAGPAGVTPRGAWAAGTAYQVSDLVTHNGSTYRRTVAGTTPTNPGADPANWEIFAARGIDGTGAVSSVNGIAPDGAGNVEIPAATGGAAGLMPAADKGKLNGIAAGATANATDAQLRDRATHTGTQAIATVVGLQAALDGKLAAAQLDTDGTLSANSDAKIASQKAVKTYVDQIIAAQDAMVFKGVVDCSGNPNYLAADRGHTYRVSVAGKIGGAAGVNVEAGDLLLCLTDGTAAGTQAAVGASWSIIQTNLDGAVIGPAAAVDGHIAIFDGVSGKLIKARTPAQLKVDLGLNNVPNVDSQNAGNLTSGTVADARLPEAMGSKKITGLREVAATPAISGGTLTIDCSAGNFFAVNMTANITALNFTNVPAAGEGYVLVLEFTATGTARTIAWPASVKWPGGTAPTLTATNGKTDTIVLYTRDGGASWRQGGTNA